MLRVLTIFLCLGVGILSPTVAATTETAQHPASEPTVKAVARVLPAVVNINTERIVRRAIRDPYEDFFNYFFGTAPRRELRHKVQSLGSGFIIDPEGYIVTNEHVVERAEDLKISVTTSDGKTYEARYITGDRESDLALLKIESPRPLPYISLNDPSPNLLGQTALVVGNPLGYGHSVARGILSATNRTLVVGEVEYKNLVQTDAAINPGNSGGPMIDLSGKLIGVASAKMAYTPQGIPTQGIGFAIPASVVAEKVKEFKQHPANLRNSTATAAAFATPSRALLGLTLQDLTPDLCEALGIDPDYGGVLISDVEPGSPAARAGIRRGSVIYRVGRFPVAQTREVENLLQKARRGTEIDLSIGVTFRRAGRTFQQVKTVSLVAR